MSYHVCEENLETVNGDVLEVLRATRSGTINPGRNDWLYARNPDGPAVIWSVRQADTGQMAGFTVVLPRRVMVDGRMHRGWNGADFSILPKFRTLGIALKLRRAAKNAIDAGRADFLYAHPNSRMQLIHERVGHSRVGSMLRYTKVLRSEAYFQRSVATRWLPGAASKTADVLMVATSRETRHRSRCETALVENIRFGEQFDDLFDLAGPQHLVVGVRDSRYLNWRYHENPLETFDAILAHDGGRLAGYALFTIKDNVAYLKDLFPGYDEALVADLTAALITSCRHRGVASISATALDGNPILRTLNRFGFVRRPDSSSMFGYANPHSPLAGRVLEPAQWFLTVGDRDV